MERFFEFFPYERPYPDVYFTSGRVMQQAWEEIVLLRHSQSNGSGSSGTTMRADTSPLIDQARSHFLMAVNAEWRAGALAYYYSLLNLAKAFLGIEGKLTLQNLKDIPIQHGLDLKAQPSSDILDLAFGIHPPRNRAGHPTNVFALLYEATTGEAWPFPDKIDATLRDIVGYCLDIGTALSSMYGEPPRAISVESLGRCDGTNVWFEMRVPSDFEGGIVNGVPLTPVTIPGRTVDDETKEAWFFAFHVPAFSFEKISVLRFGRRQIGGEAYETVKNSLKQDITTAFKGQTEVFVFADDHRWLYVPKIEIGGHKMPWHPLLSDYLFAFVLGSVVRYQPFLVVPGTKSYDLGESWCNQSPITALRYFLVRFTNPPMRLKSVG